MNNILVAVICFALISVVLGVILALASKIFAVNVDERIDKIAKSLPGANCGGCGFAGCAALAQAIVEGKAKPDACGAASDEAVQEIAKVMGLDNSAPRVRYRAQVMCCGTSECAKKKYIYDGVHDCIAANRLAGGDKLCPNGCIGLGSCASACKFDAISVKDGVAAVDYNKCKACGECVSACPKGIIKLIPYEAKVWVGCSSHDKGAITRGYCDVGCIGCKLCEKKCSVGAIKVDGSVAQINYELCTGCMECADACPRKIIKCAQA